LDGKRAVEARENQGKGLERREGGATVVTLQTGGCFLSGRSGQAAGIPGKSKAPVQYGGTYESKEREEKRWGGKGKAGSPTDLESPNSISRT